MSVYLSDHQVFANRVFPSDGEINRLGYKITFPDKKSVKVTNTSNDKSQTVSFDFEIEWTQAGFTFANPPEKGENFISCWPSHNGVAEAELQLGIMFGDLD